MPSTNKRVLVARFDRESLHGFVQTPEGLGPNELELLTREGSVIRVPYSETKAISFVREFSPRETWREHRAFLTRPKSAGLWVRFRFRDGDSIEGVISNNLLAIETNGFSFTPPDPTFQNQRMFVPREALEHAEILGVIGSPLRRRTKVAEDAEKQIQLFE